MIRLIETGNRISYQWLRREERVFNGDRVSVWEDEKSQGDGWW